MKSSPEVIAGSMVMVIKAVNILYGEEGFICFKYETSFQKCCKWYLSLDINKLYWVSHKDFDILRNYE